MPILESTDHVTPRSALRHRLIGDDATRQKPIVSVGATPVVQRASRLLYALNKDLQNRGDEARKLRP